MALQHMVQGQLALHVLQAHDNTSLAYLQSTLGQQQPLSSQAHIRICHDLVAPPRAHKHLGLVSG